MESTGCNSVLSLLVYPIFKVYKKQIYIHFWSQQSQRSKMNTRSHIANKPLPKLVFSTIEGRARMHPPSAMAFAGYLYFEYRPYLIGHFPQIGRPTTHIKPRLHWGSLRSFDWMKSTYMAERLVSQLTGNLSRDLGHCPRKTRSFCFTSIKISCIC